MLANYIFRKLRHIQKGVFIECGANDGIQRSNGISLEKKLKWRGYNLEPNPHCFKQLIRNRPKCTNLNIGLSDKIETLEFVVHYDQVRGNLSGRSFVKDDRKIGAKDEVIKINCITYRDLIEQQNIAKVDFFSLDVEGHECIVLKGMEGCPILPKWLCVEHKHSDKKLLRKMIENMGFKLEKELQKDYVFVR
jgi:FkbM family methyltransferase